MARRIDPAQGLAAVRAWRLGETGRSVLATAVRFTLQDLESDHPGHAVEVRVPPFGAVQCMPGVRHRRGTPPAVVEMAPETWLRLVTGRVSWEEAVADGRVQASGIRSDLGWALPLAGLRG
ncbi:MAG: sterol carrier family protein [Microbacteriaceae bacterium]|jgi:hypothetical protein|nr:sterol carrier family protein [Microbacteriaceae bacterium]